MTAERTVHHRSFAATTNNYVEPLRAYLRADREAQRRCDWDTCCRCTCWSRCAAMSFTAHSAPSRDGCDERLTGVKRHGVELVELTDALNDLADRRIGGDPVGHLLQRLPCLHLDDS